MGFKQRKKVVCVMEFVVQLLDKQKGSFIPGLRGRLECQACGDNAASDLGQVLCGYGQLIKTGLVKLAFWPHSVCLDTPGRLVYHL